MKSINFNKVTIKNFLSVGQEPVEVEFTPGLWIITGTNKDKLDRRNGVGKSTIADSIHFAVFGNTIRELKKENIVNNLIGTDCQVSLEFCIDDGDTSIQYKIIRMLEPSRCYFYINGEDKTRDSIINTTEYIQKLLNVTSDVFQNCVIMTLNNTVPFMGKKKVEKRKFIEGIFGLEVFGQMLNHLRLEHNNVKRDSEVIIGKYEEVDRSYESAKKRKDDFVDKRKERINKLEGRRVNNITELERLEDKIVSVDGDAVTAADSKIKIAEKNIDKCESKITNLNKTVTTLEAELKFKVQTLNKVGTNKDKCPVCLKSIDDSDRDHINAEKESFNNDITGIKLNIDSKNQKLNKAADVKSILKGDLQTKINALNECKLQIRDIENNKKRIDQLIVWNSEIDSELKNVNTETDQFDISIKECKDRLDKLQAEIDSIKHRLSILDVVKFIVSEEGVKSYIVKKILQLFNSKLAYYLDKMDANCLCIFNEYFEEEIINEKGKQCSYYNFSGAERKNIDLACLFAFMDIRRLQGSASYNFSIYDELLDTSLDERGVDLVLNILRDRVEKYNECIMVISHRKESVKIGSHYKNVGGVIFLEKENGFTRRVEFSE
jgi:DNA repair exonuclease SbcCD ATPase subunit